MNPRGTSIADDSTGIFSPSRMDQLLTGHNLTPRIVACHLLNDQQIRVYKRVQGTILCEDAEFFPFFHLSDRRYLDSFQKKHWLKELEGNNPHRFLAVFTRWSDLWEAVRVSLEYHSRITGSPLAGFGEAEFLHLRPDPVSQFLMQTGMTLFKEMEFQELLRFQIGIATSSSKGNTSDPHRTDDRILAISLSDNSGWSEVLDGRKFDEKGLLERFVALVGERDPDVIEGHDLFSHDLPYIIERCHFNDISCSIARDGSEPRLFSSRSTPADPDRDAGMYEVAGRHLVDTLLQVEYYDFSKRSLESYDIESLARHFGLSGAKTVFLKRPTASNTWKESPGKIITALKGHTKTILAVSDHLSPSSFYLAQLVPLSFGTIARTGSAVKIETLLLREYLRLKQSIPKPESGFQTTGGYADIFMTGVFAGVVHADVESLYPSIILSRAIQPRTDSLGVFTRLLDELVRMRLDAKHRMKKAVKTVEKAKLDALQSAFKILINSFYGYLGYVRGLFNDYKRADEVTGAGQELLHEIVRRVELYNGQVIEVDTDGVYFLPPDNVSGKEGESALVDRISESLPKGINLVMAGRFKKMMSYKKKNYAILNDEDGLIIRGSSLTSRAMEPFLRRFLRLAILQLLEGTVEALHTLYAELRSDITQHRWEVSTFARTEMIHDSFATYEREIGEGKRNPSAVYEVARLAGLEPKPGDRISYYVTGTSSTVKISENCKLAEEWDPHFPDENTSYYLGRLSEAAAKFEVFFNAEDFRSIFSTDDLFGFDPKGIAIISRRVSESEQPPQANETRSEFRIWLDTG